MKAILSLSGLIIMVFGCNAQKVDYSSKQLIIDNSDSSYCHFYSDSFAFKNITYSREYLTNDKGRDEYIVKKTNYINHIDAFKDQRSTINLAIYSTNPAKLIKSITKNVDEVFINEDYISTITYGCCGAVDSGELFTIWDNKTFLKYGTKYFCVEIDGGRIRLFFGYVCVPNQGDSAKGILNYIVAMGERIKDNNDIKYTYKYHNAGKIIFRAEKSESKYSDASMQIYDLSRDIHIIKNGQMGQGRKPEGQYYEELYSYLGPKTTVNDINITPLQIRPWSDTANPIFIPIIHGYLFGDSVHTERTIYLKPLPHF